MWAFYTLSGLKQAIHDEFCKSTPCAGITAVIKFYYNIGIYLRFGDVVSSAIKLIVVVFFPCPVCTSWLNAGVEV